MSECVFTAILHHVPGLARACVCSSGVGARGLRVAVVLARIQTLIHIGTAFAVALVPGLARAFVGPLGVGACGLLVALVRAFGAFIDVFAVFAVFALVPGLARAFL